MRPEIEAVRDRASLLAYLETLEGDAGLLTARRVMFRSAARVLPLALGFLLSESAAKHNLTALPVFGAVAISGVASLSPTSPIDRDAAHGAYAAYFDAGANFDPTYTAPVATAAAGAAPAAYAPAYAQAAAGVAYRAADAVLTDPDAAAAVWEGVRADLERSAAEPTEGLSALWQGLEESEHLGKAWADAKRQMEADTAGKWGFWIRWYERVRAGREFHADKLAEILNPLREDDWKKGPAHINPKFEKLLALYREEDLNTVVAATPMGEVVEYVPARDVLVLRPQDQVSESYLDDVREQIASAARIFAGDEDHNLSGSLRRELRILEDAQTRHAKRPVIILQDVRRVLDRMDHKERSEGLPSAEADADIADFREILSRVQLDLIALSPEVRKYHEATKPAATAEECALLAQAAEVAKEAGDEELAAILQDTADALKDPNATAADRRSMFYAAASRLSRMWKVARSGLKESVSLGKEVVFATTMLKWFSDQPVVKEAIKLIMEIFLKP